MKDNVLRKGLVCGIIILFIGVSIVPLIGSKSVEKSPVSDDTVYIGDFSGNTIVRISPSTQTVETGETFYVDVYVEPGEPMPPIFGVIVGSLSFDPALIHANSVTKGPFFGGKEIMFSGGTIDNVAGTISNGYAHVFPADAVTTPGSVFVISFTAQQINGTSVLDLEGLLIAYLDPIPLYPDVYDGSVTVLDDTAPLEINNVMLTASNPLDTEPGFGWENFSCTVTDSDGVDEVKLVTYPGIPPSLGTTEYLMTNIPGTDTYYYTTTLPYLGCYRWYDYHIWADDTMGNNATSSPEQFFLPMNEDVDMNGCAYFEDLIAIVMMYGDTGPPGWIREDVNNDGRIYFGDIIAVVMHYRECCWD